MLKTVREVWAGLAGVPVSFGDPVVVSPESLLCPPGWAGVVVIGDAAIVTAPSARAASVMRETLAGLPVVDWTAPETWPAAEVLGPATLAYCSRLSVPSSPGISRGDVADLVASVSEDEAGEAGLDEITSEAFVIRSEGRVVAAAGYRLWPGDVAHLSVLTAPSHRGRGLAKQVAAAATADALEAGLLPQWRARPEPSRQVARALGFIELGAQLSVRLG
jgi:GNAT superfamily N-acetyltransferase